MIKLLFADDHSIVRDGLRRLLEMYRDIQIVGEARDGQEAIALSRKLNPDVVLLDIGMPTTNGLEALKEIKETCPDVKVLVLSQYDLDEYLFMVLRNGGSGYILKETASDELIGAIRTAAEGKIYLSSPMTTTLVSEFLSIDPSKPKLKTDLTLREEEVLRLLAQGCSGRQIAERLSISVKTAHTHRYNIMEKLNLHNRVELVHYAIRKGLIVS